MDRRAFLGNGSAGFISFSSTARWGFSFTQSELGMRNAPENPVTLQSDQVEVTLNRTDGLPYKYSLKKTGTALDGESAGGKIIAVLCRLDSWEFQPVSLIASSVKETSHQVDFFFHGMWGNSQAVSFSIRYLLDDSTLFVTLEDVQEHHGFQLIQVELPRLASVQPQDDGAWLAHGDEGGSVALLKDATPGHLPPNRFWGNALATLPVVMVGTRKSICVLETTAYMDGTELSVWEHEGQRRASLGTIQAYRVNGSLGYDMNEGNGAPRIHGNRNTPNLLIEQKSSCRLDFIGDVDGNGSIDWLDGAKLVRKRMPPIPNTYYHDKFQYDILCDLPRPRLPVCTFPELEDRVSQLAIMIDGAPQIVQIWGWQYRGKDTGYPAVKEVNHRLGTYEDLLHLKKNCKEKYNSLITLSDNYDDAYKSSPEWDTNVIARRPDGELWFSRDWTGEPSFVIGLAKYMDGPGTARVHYTCDHYKIEDVAHVDVLTYFSIRNDWDINHPASGIKNLKARYKVIDLFKEHGVDVTSEFIRYAFIGKVSSFQNGMSGGVCPFGGQPVPLQSAIYRKSAIWGQQGHPIDNIDRVLKALFYNGYAYVWGSEDPPFNVSINDLTELYYLSHIPWFKFHTLDIQAFRRDGDRAVIQLEGNSNVEVNWKTRDYAVTLNGVEVARNGNTFCPFDDNRIAFYSLRGETLKASLPKGWDGQKVAAISLAIYEPDREEIMVHVTGNLVQLKVPARRPVMLYRDGVGARNRLLPSRSRPS
ncbi:endo-alpha-N-acetylgalactosaminidase family protein [Edaphobacter flagellatus]|uniref:endo-alpha-N-acetylgalactosaminidase family protein n=1 Tax=Edaphobacter flagellatus TaxID=1933044 RepID=UPI0021B23601|nr:endo-alpha-N-acetylgalactosaminidase family protein [Edaphobacter flagellatus]